VSYTLFGHCGNDNAHLFLSKGSGVNILASEMATIIYEQAVNESLPFKAIEILGDGSAKRKPDSDIVDAYTQAAIWALMSRRKINFYDTANLIEIFPDQIIDSIVSH
jgi:hypothetical protein